LPAEPVVRVFPVGDPKGIRDRLLFFGAEDAAASEFLAHAGPLVVAVPSGLPGAGNPRLERFLAGMQAAVLRTKSHLLFSVPRAARVDDWRPEEPLNGIVRRAGESIERYTGTRFRVPIPGGSIDLSDRPLLMGILNVTPDSFSDGGAYRSHEEAAERGLEMAEEGAAILDVGGESTRPGSEPVPAKEELRRILPVLRALSGSTDAVISIDTTKAPVAREAIAAGARIVNDTSGLGDDPEMAHVVRESGCAVVLMHRRGVPATMQHRPGYESLFDELLAELSASVNRAVAAGIERERILVDPGIGFGKRLEDNLALHRHLGELRVLGRPIVFGSSRKAFLGTITGARAGERVLATAASVAVAVMNGAHVLRVHDVKEMREVMLVAAAIRGAVEC
jgi:dihydropteroate synthase